MSCHLFLSLGPCLNLLIPLFHFLALTTSTSTTRVSTVVATYTTIHRPLIHTLSQILSFSQLFFPSHFLALTTSTTSHVCHRHCSPVLSFSLYHSLISRILFISSSHTHCLRHYHMRSPPPPSLHTTHSFSLSQSLFLTLSCFLTLPPQPPPHVRCGRHRGPFLILALWIPPPCFLTLLLTRFLSHHLRRLWQQPWSPLPASLHSTLSSPISFSSSLTLSFSLSLSPHLLKSILDSRRKE